MVGLDSRTGGNDRDSTMEADPVEDARLDLRLLASEVQSSKRDLADEDEQLENRRDRIAGGSRELERCRVSMDGFANS